MLHEFFLCDLLQGIKQQHRHGAYASACLLCFGGGYFASYAHPCHARRGGVPGVGLHGADCANQRRKRAAHARNAGEPNVAVVQTGVAAAGVQNVVGLAAYANRAARVCGQCAGSGNSIARAGAAIYATGLGAGLRKVKGFGGADDFRAVAPNYRWRACTQQCSNGLVAVGRSACAYGVEHHGYAARIGGGQRQLHALHPVRIKRAYVQNQRLGNTSHIGHLFVGMRHNRRCTRCQQHVGVKVDNHQIGDVVYQRVGCAYSLYVGP